MISFRALQQSIDGWMRIVRGQPDWQDSFRLSWPGLATAVVLFYLFAFLGVVLASFSYGVPTLTGFIATMVIQSLYLLALVIGIFATRAAVTDRGPVLPVLIPGVYALVYYLVLVALISLVFGPLLPALWVGLLYMFFRLGRVAGGWTIGVSAAFAVLSVLLLVGTPIALYMMPAPVPAA
jgi:hypothetical protein